LDKGTTPLANSSNGPFVHPWISFLRYNQDDLATHPALIGVIPSVMHCFAQNIWVFSTCFFFATHPLANAFCRSSLAVMYPLLCRSVFDPFIVMYTPDCCLGFSLSVYIVLGYAFVSRFYVNKLSPLCPILRKMPVSELQVAVYLFPRTPGTVHR
jgi:hypothetical protein